MTHPREQITHGAGEGLWGEPTSLRHTRMRGLANAAAALLAWTFLSGLLGIGVGFLSLLVWGWTPEGSVVLGVLAAFLGWVVAFLHVVWTYRQYVQDRALPPEATFPLTPLPELPGSTRITRTPGIPRGQFPASAAAWDVPIPNRLRVMIGLHRQKTLNRSDGLGCGLAGLFTGVGFGAAVGFVAGGVASGWGQWSQGEAEGLGMTVGFVAAIGFGLLGGLVCSFPFLGIKESRLVRKHVQHLVDHYPDRVQEWGGVEGLHFPEVLSQILAKEEQREDSP